jgi:hypothetical protein
MLNVWISVAVNTTIPRLKIEATREIIANHWEQGIGYVVQVVMKKKKIVEIPSYAWTCMDGNLDRREPLI